MNLQAHHLRRALWPFAVWLLAVGGVDAFGVRMGLQTVTDPSSTITTPPDPRATDANYDLIKRANNATVAPSCPFGGCGTSCLAQGAFCCNPGMVVPGFA
jgi:hypothetical protein